MLATQLKEQVKAAIRQATLEVESELGVDNFIRSIMGYPRIIREQQDRVEQAKQDYRGAKGGIQVAESILLAEVSAEKDPSTGKARYSNKESREAALEQMKPHDQDYQAALAVFQKAEEAYNAAQFELQRLTDEFKAHQIVGEILVGRLAIRAYR